MTIETAHTAPLQPIDTNWGQPRRRASEPSKRLAGILTETELNHVHESDQFSYIPSAPLNIRPHAKRYEILQVYNSPGTDIADVLETSEVSQGLNQDTGSDSEASDTSEPCETIVNPTKLRSNGQIDNLVFPSQLSSSFEIESCASVDLSPQSSYAPAIEPANDNVPINVSAPLQLRSSLINESMFYSGDAFRECMEERLLRWKPTDSQHNAELILSGRHPYQAKKFGVKSGVSGNSSSLFSMNWFSSKSKDTSTAFVTASTTPVPITCPQQPSPNDPDIDHMLKQVHFNANSSNSILPATTIDSNAAILLTTGEELIHPYTPNAIPLAGFQLNFNRCRNQQLEGNGNIYDSMNHDIIRILDGSDNFLTTCFQSIIDMFKC